MWRFDGCRCDSKRAALAPFFHSCHDAYSVIFMFHAVRMAMLSAVDNSPRRLTNNDFSAVTNRFRRAMDGFASPAADQSAIGTSN